MTDTSADDDALIRLVRRRVAAGPSRPLADLAAELGISRDELGTDGQGSSALGVREIVRLLNGTLGATLVSAMAGSLDPSAAHRWAQEGGTEPDREAMERLRLAHRAWTLISSAEDDDVARLWFIGANPWLGDISPVEAISKLESERVMNAVRAMVDGTFAG